VSSHILSIFKKIHVAVQCTSVSSVMMMRKCAMFGRWWQRFNLCRRTLASVSNRQWLSYWQCRGHDIIKDSPCSVVSLSTVL